MSASLARRPGAIVAITMFVVIWTLTTHGKYSASGDEPHYLMVTRSVYADFDVDVANNYAANDGRLIGHDHLEAGAHARLDRANRLVTVHDLGVSFALLPVYAVAAPFAARVSESLLARFRMTRGLFVYALVSLTLLAGCSIAFGFLTRALATTTTPQRAVLTGLLIGLSPPILSHSFLVFPEVFGFVVACAVVCWSLNGEPRMRGTWPLVAALGWLPWCHRKFSFLVLACALVMMIAQPSFWRRRSWSDLILLAALFVVPQVALHAWTIATWGTVGGAQMMDRLPFTISGAPRGFLGLLLDRQYGLVSGAPWYFLLPAAWMLAGRRAASFLLPVFALLVPMAGFVVWWGGFSPAARYLVPLLPFCAVALALALDNAIFRRAAVVAAALQVPITAYAWQHPRSLWPIGEGNPLLETLGPAGRAYEHVLPALVGGGSLLQAEEVALVALALNLLLIASCRRAVGVVGPAKSVR
jgi:hypothetical protein